MICRMIKFCHVEYLLEAKIISGLQLKHNRTTLPPHLWKQDFNYMAERCLSIAQRKADPAGWDGNGVGLRQRKLTWDMHTHMHKANVNPQVQVVRRLAFKHLRSWMLAGSRLLKTLLIVFLTFIFEHMTLFGALGTVWVPLWHWGQQFSLKLSAKPLWKAAVWRECKRDSGWLRCKGWCLFCCQGTEASLLEKTLCWRGSPISKRWVYPHNFKHWLVFKVRAFLLKSSL